jgi:hypothetical protein
MMRSSRRYRALNWVIPLKSVVAAMFLAACASVPPATPSHVALPSPLLPTLSEKWVDPHGGVIWPPSEGFSSQPFPLILPPGLLIDRFGSPYGRFFSPKGAGYSARALPYECDKLNYTTFRVMSPIFVWAGKAAPWFDQPGGATQFETDATAAQLVADAALKPVEAAAASPCKSK